MGEERATSLLRRKAAAGRVSVAAQRQITPCKALGQAVVQAADKRLDLPATVASCALRTGTLAELLETLPEGGLLAVLDGPAEAQGLMVLDAAALSAVIEMTMTGRLAPRPSQPRRPTRTDAALTADLIDDILRRFEAPFDGTAPARWLAGFGYATFLDDPRPLALMLEDIDYRILTLQVDLDQGRRSCRLMLALPAEGRGGLVAPVAGAAAPPGARARAAGAGDIAPPAEPDAEPAPRWQDAIAAGVMAGRVTLDTRLHRFHLPVSDLGRLVPGLEIRVPVEALDEAEILTAEGRCLARGRLGQVRGYRAIRLTGEGAPEADPAGDRAEAGGQARAPGMLDAPGAGRASADGMAELPDLPGAAAGSAAAGEVGAFDSEDDPLAGLPMPDLPDLGGPDEPASLPAFPDLPDLPPLGTS